MRGDVCVILLQLDVIGQTLFDITDDEEEATIKKNLKPQGSANVLCHLQSHLAGPAQPVWPVQFCAFAAVL